MAPPGRVEQAGGTPPRNPERLRLVYGPATWNVYERLDCSLDPTGPDSLLDLAGDLQRFDVEGFAVEPVALHVERAVAAVRDAGLADRIALHHGVIHELPYPTITSTSCGVELSSNRSTI